MYIDLREIARGLQKVFSVERYHLDNYRPVTGFDFLPKADKSRPLQQDDDCLYLCEYRDLLNLNPQIYTAPLLCIVDPKVQVDPVHFFSRQAVVVYHGSVRAVLLELSRLMYECGGTSSGLLDISRILLRCADVDELLQEGFRYFGNPLILTDAAQKISACTAPSLIPDTVYQQIASLTHLPVGHPAPEMTRQMHEADGAPVLYPGSGELPTVLCKELTIGESTLGYLHLLQFNREIRREDFYVMELLGNLVTVDLWKRPEWNRMNRGEQTAAFLRNVLDGGFSTEEQLHQQQCFVGMPVRKYVCVIAIQAYQPELSPRMSLDDLSRQFASQLPETFGFLYKNSILLVYGTDRYPEDMKTVLEPVCTCLRQYHMAAGVSNPAHSIVDLPNALFQANTALRLGAAFSDEPVLQYKDYAAYHMIEIGLENDRVGNFIMPELGRLLEYCRVNGDMLLNTLHVYVSCGCSRKAAAEKLHVHQNTLHYRVQQIEEIMGIRIRDARYMPDLMFSLQVVFYAKKMLNDEQIVLQ